MSERRVVFEEAKEFLNNSMGEMRRGIVTLWTTKWFVYDALRMLQAAHRG
jgi:hypothetical protein